ncbi:hypothetical protein MMC29_002700 [Sticta canariensis]|nr:hypothetical protein [Sticta canariensis]
MKVFTLSAAVALFAAYAHAAPALTPVQVEARDVFIAALTFHGAAGASYTVLVPTNNTIVYIDNPLSVSSIDSQSVAFCTIRGSEGGSTVVTGNPESVDVSPPQPQIWAICQI